MRTLQRGRKFVVKHRKSLAFFLICVELGGAAAGDAEVRKAQALQSTGRHLVAPQNKGMEVQVGLVMPMNFTSIVDEQKVFPGLIVQLHAEICFHKS